MSTDIELVEVFAVIVSLLSEGRRPDVAGVRAKIAVGLSDDEITRYLDQWYFEYGPSYSNLALTKEGSLEAWMAELTVAPAFQPGAESGNAVSRAIHACTVLVKGLDRIVDIITSKEVQLARREAELEKRIATSSTQGVLATNPALEGRRRT
ncbi:TPA: hypothetical protein QDZ10_001954 [Stenotrophomonas maltophilia]|nr:hypothetical protein [Stenotrophomonas maltophilia]